MAPQVVLAADVMLAELLVPRLPIVCRRAASRMKLMICGLTAAAS
jgi:hypothetical protein